MTPSEAHADTYGRTSSGPQRIHGRSISGGKASGPALVSRTPINFVSGHTKPWNLITPSRCQDPHHELYRQELRGTVLVYPTSVGSTYSGLIVMGLICRGIAPAALIVQQADPYLVSGSVLAEVWFNQSIPILEIPRADLFDLIRTGDQLSIDGDSAWLDLCRSRQ